MFSSMVRSVSAIRMSSRSTTLSTRSTDVRILYAVYPPRIREAKSLDVYTCRPARDSAWANILPVEAIPSPASPPIAQLRSSVMLPEFRLAEQKAFCHADFS